MREDQDNVLGVEILNRGLADGQNILVTGCWPQAGFEEQNTESKTLWLRTFARVEPLHPVCGGNSNVI